MEQEKNKNGVIALLVVVIVILLALVILLATGIISFKSDNTVDDTSNNNVVANDKVDIDLSINNATIAEEGSNARIHVDGTINLSYDNNKYAGVTLSGYCLGSDNEKYLMNGPGDGRALFHNDGNNNLTLTENISQNIEYPDGTVKAWSDIDWKNVKIKYCKIEKMTAILNEGTDNPETVLNVEKSFN